MSHLPFHPTGPATGTCAGELLRRLRRQAGLSQMQLALLAGVSQRHLSCVETARAKASPSTLHALLSALDVPLEHCNEIFLAAGFAPRYVASGVNAPTLKMVSDAVEHILQANNPAPAIVIDSHWNVTAANASTGLLLAMLCRSGVTMLALAGLVVHRGAMRRTSATCSSLASSAYSGARRSIAACTVASSGSGVACTNRFMPKGRSVCWRTAAAASAMPPLLWPIPGTSLRVHPKGVPLAAAQVRAVFIDEPHARIDQVMGTFMAKGNGVVIKGAVLGVAQPEFFFVNHRPRSGRQVDTDQAATRLGVEHLAELFPVGQGEPVGTQYLDTDHLGARTIGDPSAIAHPIRRDGVDTLLSQGGELQAD